MSVGQELLDVPIADMVRDLAAAVAEGQLSLDRASIETLKFLADQAHAIDLIPEVVEVISPARRSVRVDGLAGRRLVLRLQQESGAPVR